MQRLSLLILIILLGFLLGWLFPVEGPIDYVYDNYKYQKCASKLAPPLTDAEKLSEEELNFLEEEYLTELLSESEEK